MGFKHLKPYTNNALDERPFTNGCEVSVKLEVIAVAIMASWEENPMGFRFRKTIKLFPGVKLNLSKSGISASVGVAGATVNFSKRGTRGTVGIPGTGISYTENFSKSNDPKAAPVPNGGGTPNAGMGFVALLLWGVVGLFVFLLIYGFVTR